MNTIELNTKANALFEELDKKKLQNESESNTYNEEYRIYANNEICNFFKNVAMNSEKLHYYSTPSEFKGFVKGIVVFKDEKLPLDIDLVCSKNYINIPTWFKKVCSIFLEISFSENIKIKEHYCSKRQWFIDAVNKFEDNIYNYRSGKESYLDVLDRLGTSSSKFKLFGLEEEDQKDFKRLELEGLLFWLKDDLDIHGWDFDSSIGRSKNDNEKDYLYFKLDINRFELYEAYLEARKKHKPSKAYPLIQNGVRKAYKEYIDRLLHELKILD